MLDSTQLGSTSSHTYHHIQHFKGFQLQSSAWKEYHPNIANPNIKHFSHQNHRHTHTHTRQKIKNITPQTKYVIFLKQVKCGSKALSHGWKLLGHRPRTPDLLRIRHQAPKPCLNVRVFGYPVRIFGLVRLRRWGGGFLWCEALTASLNGSPERSTYSYFFIPSNVQSYLTFH